MGLAASVTPAREGLIINPKIKLRRVKMLIPSSAEREWAGRRAQMGGCRWGSYVTRSREMGTYLEDAYFAIF